MAVTVNAVGTEQSATFTTPADLTGVITVPAGSTGLLLHLYVNFGGETPSSVVWDQGGANQAMTLLGSVTALGGVTRLYGLVNPTSGNKTLRVVGLGSSQVAVVALSHAGGNTSSLAAHYNTFTSATGSSTTASVTISSATGNMVAAAHVNGSASYTATNQTNWFIGAAAGTGLTAGNYANGAATVALTGTLNGSATWDSIGINVSAAASGLPFQKFWGGTSFNAIRTKKPGTSMWRKAGELLLPKRPDLLFPNRTLIRI